MTNDEIRERIEEWDRLGIEVANMIDRRADLEQEIAEGMGRDHERTIDGLGVIERSKRVSRTKWDNEPLRRAIKDARYRSEVDPDTGEVTVIEQTPAERLEFAYSLTGSNVKIKALRALGLDPDEYCQTERRGYRIKIIK